VVERLRKSGIMNRVRFGGSFWLRVWRRRVMYWIVWEGVKYIFRLMPMKCFFWVVRALLLVISFVKLIG